ncbi:MAG: NUDIX domain-containing protein [Acidimicrobiaceae bacterium]|nr:NUDIX domain-containing protein [Acidimicrobiaceae bacterium]MCY3950613.1 NUDIX domain-containing protein [Acidimicrobiaceae bacterium]MDE0136181.1 NUDIX domain-containing protein [Acidimicrobiaceae bacterium]MYG61341.1 NUDIX domain-containing protein [Acidimicrobiales bacterium]
MTEASDGAPERRASVGAKSPGSGGDYDPEAVPVRDAATVMILSDENDPHVLMLKRNSRSIFVGDMWVYPGGAVDPEDATQIADETVSGLTDDDASFQIGIERGGIAFWVAALRETFEEAGILLAHHDHPVGVDDPRDLPSGIIDLSPPDVAERFSQYRDEVNAGERDFIETVRSEDLLLDGDNVYFIGRWVTPLGSPRRYDTRFFLTAMPDGQVPLPDHDEAVEHQWVRPADAIRRNETGDMVMMTPTIGMLQRLASFATISEAVAAAQRGAPADDEHVRIRYDNEGPHRIAFPADPDYLESDGSTEVGILRWPLG